MQSVWETGLPATTGSTITQPGHVDLLVVGAGIVGLCTALHYKREHVRQRVLVVERGPVASGASVKNAGFACFGSPSELLHDAAAEGADAMLARVEERWRGLLELRNELGDGAIGFEPTGGHEVYRVNDPLYPRVADRFTWLNRELRAIFSNDVFLWDAQAATRNGLRSLQAVARTDREGPVHSGRLMAALIARAKEAGVETLWNTPLMRIEEEGDRALAITAAGGAIPAARIVVATNGYAAELLPGIDVRPARGQVLLTSPIPDLPLKGTFHMDEGFYYWRDFEGRVLLGGGRNLDVEGETTSEDAVTGPIQGALERLLREVILPGQSFTVERRWSGIMGFRSSGKSPIVQHMSPHVIAAVGLSGMGVAIGIRVARRAAELAGE